MNLRDILFIMKSCITLKHVVDNSHSPGLIVVLKLITLILHVLYQEWTWEMCYEYAFEFLSSVHVLLELGVLNSNFPTWKAQLNNVKLTAKHY